MSSILLNILNVWMRSPLSLLNFKDGKFKDLRRWSYERLLTCGINLVALRCTLSMALDCLFRKGYHITLQYSRCGLTIDLYNVIIIDFFLDKGSFNYRKHFIAVAIQLFIWTSKVKFLSKVILKSFSVSQLLIL